MCVQGAGASPNVDQQTLVPTLGTGDKATWGSGPTVRHKDGLLPPELEARGFGCYEGHGVSSHKGLCHLAIVTCLPRSWIRP